MTYTIKSTTKKRHYILLALRGERKPGDTLNDNGNKAVTPSSSTQQDRNCKLKGARPMKEK